jgi:hypothetical protein
MRRRGQRHQRQRQHHRQATCRRLHAPAAPQTPPAAPPPCACAAAAAAALCACVCCASAHVRRCSSGARSRQRAHLGAGVGAAAAPPREPAPRRGAGAAGRAAAAAAALLRVAALAGGAAAGGGEGLCLRLRMAAVGAGGACGTWALFVSRSRCKRPRRSAQRAAHVATHQASSRAALCGARARARRAGGRAEVTGVLAQTVERRRRSQRRRARRPPRCTPCAQPHSTSCRNAGRYGGCVAFDAPPAKTAFRQLMTQHRCSGDPHHRHRRREERRAAPLRPPPAPPLHVYGGCASRRPHLGGVTRECATQRCAPPPKMSSLPRSWEVDPAVQSVMGFVGAALALTLFLSPLCVVLPRAKQSLHLPNLGHALRTHAALRARFSLVRRRTFRRIAARGNTEDFSGTPYVVASTQCAAWLLYCSITPGRTAPGVTNGLGFVIEVGGKKALRLSSRVAQGGTRERDTERRGGERVGGAGACARVRLRALTRPRSAAAPRPPCARRAPTAPSSCATWSPAPRSAPSCARWRSAPSLRSSSSPAFSHSSHVRAPAACATRTCVPGCRVCRSRCARHAPAPVSHSHSRGALSAGWIRG